MASFARGVAGPALAGGDASGAQAAAAAAGAGLPPGDGDAAAEPSRAIVPAGESKRVEIDVIPGNVVSWEFRTDGGDIGFMIALERSDGEVQSLIDEVRVNSHEEAVEGSIIAEDAGTMILQWDNSYSWMTSKELIFIVEMDERPPSAAMPVPGFDAPEQPSGGGSLPATSTLEEPIDESAVFADPRKLAEELMYPKEEPAATQDDDAGRPLAPSSSAASQPQAAQAAAAASSAEQPTAQPAAPTGPLPRVVLGTMTMGGQTDQQASEQMFDNFVKAPCVSSNLTAGRVELDTARMYQHGGTETVLGRLFAKRPDLKQRAFIATKANPFKGYGETLRPESVKAQLDASLADLGVDVVDVLYLHAPDHSTCLEATLQACQDLHQEGKFRELGLSNYAAWQVVHIFYLCKARGWVLPTIYQGMYNGITRDVERELLPALRTLGIRFYAYNPLAGGFLTGKHQSIANVPSGGRFGEHEWGIKYRDRFWKPEYFRALDLVKAKCEQAGVTVTAAAIRWMMHHSQLAGGQQDAVILGASTVAHLDENLRAAEQGPLPAEVVAAMDGAWEICRPSCPSYSR